jgi:hypothetical protein
VSSTINPAPSGAWTGIEHALNNQEAVPERRRYNGRAVELQLDLTVEANSQGVIVAVTHWVPRSFRQEVVGNAGFSREKAQTPCRNDRAIWEIRAYARFSLTGPQRPARVPALALAADEETERRVRQELDDPESPLGQALRKEGNEPPPLSVRKGKKKRRPSA